MKEFFSEMFKLLSISVLIICFAFASFLFISNFYHYKEVSRSETVNLNADVNYQKYKKTLVKIDKKMKSVDYDNVKYSTTAKPIYEYYNTCIKVLNEGTFNKLGDKGSINAKDIYDSNREILTQYNNKCIFYIPYNITVINKAYNPSVSFNSIFKNTEMKRSIIIDNADYLVKSGLGNSSYSFATENSKSSIYDKTFNELRLTINNYNLMASILDDVANWYVLEFGGNN